MRHELCSLLLLIVEASKNDCFFLPVRSIYKTQKKLRKWDTPVSCGWYPVHIVWLLGAFCSNRCSLQENLKGLQLLNLQGVIGVAAFCSARKQMLTNETSEVEYLSSSSDKNEESQSRHLLSETASRQQSIGTKTGGRCCVFLSCHRWMMHTHL